jgi:hypothetical protein
MLPYHSQEDEMVFIVKKNILVIVSLIAGVVNIFKGKFHFETQSDRHGQIGC